MDRTWDFSGLRSPVYLASDNPSNTGPWVTWDRNENPVRKCPLLPLWPLAGSLWGRGSSHDPEGRCQISDKFIFTLGVEGGR